MATVQELEEIIVKMTGDATKYVAMLDDAQNKTIARGTAISRAIEDATDRAMKALESIGKSSASYIDVVSKAAEAVVTAKGAITSSGEETEKTATKVKDAKEKTSDWSKEIRQLGGNLAIVSNQLNVFKHQAISTFEAFGIQERAERGLSAALSSNDKIVDKSIDRFKEYASSIQEVTVYSDQVTIGLLKSAAAYGLNESQAKRAVKEAIALTSIREDVSLDAALKMTSKLAEGSTERLGESLPTLGLLKDQAEKTAAAHKILGDAFKVAESEAKSSQGSIKQLSNSWRNFREIIGSVISETIAPLVTKLKSVIDRIQGMTQPAKEFIANFLILGAVVGTVTVALSTLALVISASTALLAAEVLAYGALFIVLNTVVRELTGVANAERELDKVRKESMRLEELRVSQFTRGTAKIINDANDIKNQVEKGSFLKEQLAKTEKDLEEYVKQVERATKLVEARRSEFNSAFTSMFEKKELLDEARNELKRYQQRLDEVRGRAELLKNTLEDLGIENSLVKSGVRELERDLAKQRDTLGMTSEEIKVYEIKMMGASQAVLSTIGSIVSFNKSLMDMNALTVEAINVLKGITDKKFNLRLDNRELTEAERQLKKMKEEFERKKFLLELRANPDEISKTQKRIDELKDHLDKLITNSPTLLNLNKEQTQNEIRQLTEHLDAMGKAIKEVSGMKLYIDTIQLQNDLVKTLEITNKLISDGAELTKRYRTPLKELKDTVRELKILAQAGVISEGVFNRALDDAAKKFLELDNAARGAREEIMLFDAVEFKSSEAKHRIAEFVNETRKQLDERARLEKARREALNEPVKVNPNVYDIERKAMEDARKYVEAQNALKKLFPTLPTPNLPPTDFAQPKKQYDDPFFKRIITEVLNVIPRRIFDQLDIMPRRIIREPAPEPRRVYDQLDTMPRRVFDKAPMPTDISWGRYPKGPSDVPADVFDRFLKERRWSGPEIAPMPREVTPGMNVQSGADLTVETDRKEMLTILRSIDTTLAAMNKKDTSVIGVAKVS